MRAAALAMPILLAACAAPPEKPAVLPVIVAADCPDPAPAASPAPAKATPASTASASYRGIQQREARAVTAPAASATYIKTIHVADDLARAALKALIAQDGHPKQAEITAARDSIDALVRALEETEGGGSM